MAKANDNAPEIAYGVWIRGRGWLRVKDGEAFADTVRANAESAAYLYGRGAVVLPFDDELLALEPTFLQRERAPWWVRLARIFG
jgi:hypothetical protein